MIIFNRWADVAPGKVGEAVTFATEIAKLIKKLTGVELTVMMPVGGNPNRIIWQAAYDNLAAMEAANEVFMASEEYHSAVAGATHLFLPGSVRDAMGKTVG